MLDAAHAAGQGVGDAGPELDGHHHLGEEDAARGIGGRASVDRHLDGVGGQVLEREVALVVGVDELVLVAQDEDLGVRHGQQEDVVGRVDDAVRATPDVVEGHGLQVGPGVDDLADQAGACHGGRADGREGNAAQAAGRAVAIGVQEGAIRSGADLRAVDVQGDARATRHGIGDEQPGEGAIGGGHDGRVELAAVGCGGVEAVAVQGRGVDGPREVDDGALGDADVGAAVGRRKRDDGECGEGVDLEGTTDLAGVAGRVTRQEGEGVVAHAEAAESQGGVEAARAGVETQVGCGPGFEVVAQLGDGRAAAGSRASEATGCAEGVAIGQAGQAQGGRLGVEREAAIEGGTGVAGEVDGGDGKAVRAIGAAVQR